MWGGVKGYALLLFLFYVNVSRMHPRSRLSSQTLTVQAPWVHLRVGWLISVFPPWVIASRFLAGNREAEVKPITFFSLLLFRVFLSFFFSWPPSDIVHLSAARRCYSLIIYILFIYYTRTYSRHSGVDMKQRQERRAEGKKKGVTRWKKKGSRHRGRNPTSIWAIDALIGDEEQTGKRERR